MLVSVRRNAHTSAVRLPNQCNCKNQIWYHGELGKPGHIRTRAFDIFRLKVVTFCARGGDRRWGSITFHHSLIKKKKFPLLGAQGYDERAYGCRVVYGVLQIIFLRMPESRIYRELSLASGAAANILKY